jgi:hypothetical protein
VFTDPGTTIARAYYPYSNGGIVYGRVEFNTKYLAGFTDEETAGTIIHEVGHTLGVGWDDWAALFDPNTGVFTPDAVGKLAALGDMRVELDYGDGTALSHWDEDRFGAELMTGFKDQKEHVLPVTIDVMGLLGHQVVETLGAKTPLADLMKEVAQVVFTRQVEAKALDLDHFQATDIMEVVPHHA